MTVGTTMNCDWRCICTCIYIYMNTHLARVRRRKSDQKRLLDHLAIQAGAFNVSNVAVAALRGEAPKAAAGRAGLAAGMEVLGKVRGGVGGC